ncbi:MAG TPA: hypothetical protein VM240_13600 [Verrucomicrobiae bacterium]|nr:hypothetical protein [Verrucomicrobiae bacterium]
MHLQPKDVRVKLDRLVADLEDCIRKVQRLKVEGDLFNLTVIAL